MCVVSVGGNRNPLGNVLPMLLLPLDAHVVAHVDDDVGGDGVGGADVTMTVVASTMLSSAWYAERLSMKMSNTCMATQQPRLIEEAIHLL